MALLFRAVGEDEAIDVLEIGGFRVRPGVGYEGGKWFATSYDDAVRWGRAFQRFLRPRPFHVARVRVPLTFLDAVQYHPSWDGIGPAYFVERDLLAWLNQQGVVRIVTSGSPIDPE